MGYTKEQKEAARKLLGLTADDVDLIEEADEFVEAILEESSDPEVCVDRIKTFLTKKGLWDEVNQTLSEVKLFSKEELRKKRPRGIALCAVLRLIK